MKAPKKFAFFSEESCSYIILKESCSYISGNGKPEKNIIFQEVIF